MEQHRDVLKACSEHFLWAAVVSSSRQELPVAVGTPQELGVDILWVRGLCAPGKVWGFVPDYALSPNWQGLTDLTCRQGDCKYVGYTSQLLLLPLHHEQL